MGKRAFLLMLMLVAVVCVGFVSAGELALPTVFTDHMVMQCGQAVPVWGTAAPDAVVTVEFAGQRLSVAVGADGGWMVHFAPLAVSAVPQKLIVSSSTGACLEIEDVLVGEVWLCSGQSNMYWELGKKKGAERTANHPLIRLYKTPRVYAEKPLKRIDGKWAVCTPSVAKEFSAVAYYFGRKLNKDLNVPIGLLQSSWGGSSIEAWIPMNGFKGIGSLTGIYERVRKTVPSSPEYKKEFSAYLKRLEKWETKSRVLFAKGEYISEAPVFPGDIILSGGHKTATKLYNGMLHAHIPFAIRGVIWYQGETNHKEGMLYTDKTRAQLNSWRRLWGYDFPYLFVQIAPFKYGGERKETLPEFWEAQAEIVKTIPKTGMAVISDYGSPKTVHPPNKLVPGTRLALLAEANVYGMDVVSTGPVFNELETLDGALRVHFDVAAGLTTRDEKPPDWFEIAGEDRIFRKAAAMIDGEAVILTSEKVSTPFAVRFAWNKVAMPNLVNSAGIPPSAFRAGKFPPFKNVALESIPAADGYRCVYRIDIPKNADYSKAIPEYVVDDSRQEQGPFSRVAYFLELEKNDGSRQYIFVSMDKFTDDIRKTGIPVALSGAQFIRKVGRLTVRSNVPGLEQCTDSDGGNIEFLSGNYSTKNGSGLPNASAETFDFDDQPIDSAPGYGCMQIHNWKAGETLLAINHWGNKGVLDVGIGNAAVGNPDWTQSQSAKECKRIQLTVLVK